MSLRSERLAKGLCPECGKEAAPYRLCETHRQTRRVARVADRLAKLGQIEKETVDGRVRYKKASNPPKIDLSKHFREPKKGDRRFAPRIGNVPIDVEKELLMIFADLNRPLRLEEILEAWGRLREKRAGGSITLNMKMIVLAKQRREERNARRAARLAAGSG